MGHMSQPVAYSDGHWIDARKLVVSAYDAGFTLGVTLAERMRTFRGRIFRLDDHLARLAGSLQIAGFDSPIAMPELRGVVEEAVRRNRPLVAADDDLGVAVYLTPGQSESVFGKPAHGPTLGVYAYPLPFAAWAGQYAAGQAMVEENRAKVVLAEAEIPQAIAQSFREGNLGIMDYYNLKNLQADTSMREGLSSAGRSQPRAEPK